MNAEVSVRLKQMSHYRQWLHHREVNLMLHEQLTEFEHKLSQLQEQVQLLENNTYNTNNTITQGLLAVQRAEQLLAAGAVAYEGSEQKEIKTQENTTTAATKNNQVTTTETRNLTDPQLKVPWWLRNMRNATEKNPQDTSPIDQQSMRADHLIERWFDRWGKPDKAKKADREDQAK